MKSMRRSALCTEAKGSSVVLGLSQPLRIATISPISVQPWKWALIHAPAAIGSAAASAIQPSGWPKAIVADPPPRIPERPHLDYSPSFRLPMPSYDSQQTQSTHHLSTHIQSL